MSILKRILSRIAKIIHFVPATEEEIERARNQPVELFKPYKSYGSDINPSSGLPMTGAFDSMGNTIGSSVRDDYYRR